MKSSHIGIFLSIILHLSFILLSLRALHFPTISAEEVIIDFKIESPAPAPIKESKAPRPLPKAIKKTKTVSVKPPKTAEEKVATPAQEEVQLAVRQKADTTRHDLTRELILNSGRFLAKQFLLENFKSDSSQTLTVKPELILPDSNALPPLSPWTYGDRIDKDIYKRNLGHEKPMPLSDLLRAGADYLSKRLGKKEKKPRLKRIPTEAELRALKVVWDQGAATDEQIYAEMDSSVKITAQQLNAILANLADEGLVSRKIVSPRNEFTIGLPFKDISIEMSELNRKNRIFQYKPRISREEMLQFLNAVLYQIENNNNKATKDTSQVKRVQKLILTLISKE